MIPVKKYNLPDFSIFEECCNTFCIWVPNRRMIVLGAGDKPETSLSVEAVIEDHIEVFKRSTGGHAVFLSPETLVISAVYINSTLTSKDLFRLINKELIRVLNSLGLQDLSQQGVSDIALGERKILGSSVQRKKDRIFYHAVLNVSQKADAFELYLLHPASEPDYRKGRTHIEFVTSLQQEGYIFTSKVLADEIRTRFSLPVFKI